MPARSPTLAFDPTPALEHTNFPSFNGFHRHDSTDNQYHDGAKEVRFEEPSVANTSIHGRHSIATSHVPLLPAIASASSIPKQSFRMTNPMPRVDMTAYFEQCRNVNEQLRNTHEQERKAWEIERTALRTRIADLEFRLNKASGGKRRLSTDISHINGRSFKTDFHVPWVPGMVNERHSSVANHPLENFKTESGKPVWEPESSLPATRVFSHEDDDVQHLPSISEDGPTDQISPQTTHENKPIPISEIDPTLDGVTIKSEGVKSSFNKVRSPIIIASPMRSPSPRETPTRDVPRLSLDPPSILDPLDAKLKRHAGHTPLAFDGSLSSTQTTVDATPREEKPPAPVQSAKRPPLRPSERSESYFSLDDMHAAIVQDKRENGVQKISEEDEEEEQARFVPEDDMPLTGPLMLDPSGESEASHTFLDRLDDKLEEVVRLSHSNSPNHSPVRPVEQQKTPGDDEGMPRLKLKKSTNFGSAYGSKRPGFCDR